MLGNKTAEVTMALNAAEKEVFEMLRLEVDDFFCFEI